MLGGDVHNETAHGKGAQWNVTIYYQRHQRPLSNATPSPVAVVLFEQDIYF
jgi:hypothetical protein